MREEVGEHKSLGITRNTIIVNIDAGLVIEYNASLSVLMFHHLSDKQHKDSIYLPPRRSNSTLKKNRRDT